jgi:hypothetical protein
MAASGHAREAALEISLSTDGWLRIPHVLPCQAQHVDGGRYLSV